MTTTTPQDFKHTAEEEANLVRIRARQLEEKTKYGYIDNRLGAYPPITDYIDAVVKGDQTQMQAYIDACLAVKARFPKPAP